MLVIYDKNTIAEVPDTLNTGDTIIISNIIYEITSKTFDYDNKELYCKVVFYDDSTSTIIEDLTKIFDSDELTTSGINTNTILGNPKFIIAMIVLSVLIKDPDIKYYSGKIQSKWNQKKIPWQDIIDNDPKQLNDSFSNKLVMIKKLLESSKIAKSEWPKLLQQYHIISFGTGPNKF